MHISFTLDSARFLERLGALQRCFDGLVATAPLSFDAIDDDERNPVIRPGEGAAGRAASRPAGPAPIRGKLDDTLAALAEELFGCTAWASLVGVASLCAEPALTAAARSFLMHCAMVVRRAGLAAWLHDLINDATMALVLDEPSDRMPVTIRPMDAAHMARWLHGAGRNRRGGKRTQQEDMAEYVRQAHRLAATCMLRWGTPSSTVADIAALLLTDPGVGMCLLREDPMVRAQGGPLDTRYRRIVEYCRRLRAQGDLEYAQALAQGSVPALQDGDPDDVTRAVDRRYLADAHRLLEAYRGLWGERTRPAAELVAEVETMRIEPDCALWRNPVYLRDLADSLMGASQAGELVQGFEERDRIRFDRGAARLERQCATVRELGVLMLPVVGFERQGLDWDGMLHAGFTARTRAWRRQCDLADDLATVVLARLHVGDDALRADAALAVLGQSVSGYCDAILPVVDAALDRQGCRGQDDPDLRMAA